MRRGRLRVPSCCAAWSDGKTRDLTRAVKSESRRPGGRALLD